MLDEQVQSIVEGFYSTLNDGDVADMDRLFTVDVVDHAPWPGHTADVAGFKAGLAEMRASFPDFHMSVERTVIQGNLVAVHFKISGTQLGKFMRTPASSKTFEVEAMDILRMKDGRISEHWGVIDEAGMAAQLGL